MNCKTTLLALSSFALFSLVVISCKKSNSSSSSGSLSATAGTSTWNASQTQGLYVSAAGDFEILGEEIPSGDTTLFTVIFAPPTAVGLSVNSDTGFVDVEYFDSKSGVTFDGSYIAGGHSIVTVTSWDSTTLQIAGTFSGVLYAESVANDSLIVSNGNFSMAYTKQ
jgi:hypothetical protein